LGGKREEGKGMILPICRQEEGKGHIRLADSKPGMGRKKKKDYAREGRRATFQPTVGDGEKKGDQVRKKENASAYEEKKKTTQHLQ